MLTSSVKCDVISIFVTRKCQKIQIVDENSWQWRGKSWYLLNDLKNFNEIFRKDVTYDNVKMSQKSGGSPFL